MSHQIAIRHFGARRVSQLARKGIRVIGLQAIPGSGDMPWANAETGYVIDDNGCGRVLSFLEMGRL